MQVQLIELKSDGRLKHHFASGSLATFWVTLMQEYPQLSDEAVKHLLPFALTYLCEASFSKPSVLKTKYRNHTLIKDDLRLCLSKTEPRIQQLEQRAKQAHVFH